MAKTIATRKRIVRRDWTRAEVKVLRQHSRDKTPVKTISRALKRTQAALRQKARTLGIPLIHGRDFTLQDTAASRHVVIVNQAFARAFFAGIPLRDIIGRRINFRSGADTWAEIVAINRDCRDGNLAHAPEPEMLVTMAQECWGYAALVMRTAGPPAALASAARSAILAVDPDQPLQDVRPFAALLDDTLPVGDDPLSLWIARAALAADDAEHLFSGPVLQSRLRLRLCRGTRAARPVAGSAPAMAALTPAQVRELLRAPVGVRIGVLGAIPPELRRAVSLPERPAAQRPPRYASSHPYGRQRVRQWRARAAQSRWRPRSSGESPPGAPRRLERRPRTRDSRSP